MSPFVWGGLKIPIKLRSATNNRVLDYLQVNPGAVCLSESAIGPKARKKIAHLIKLIGKFLLRGVWLTLDYELIKEYERLWFNSLWASES